MSDRTNHANHANHKSNAAALPVATETPINTHFIRQMIESDLQSQKNGSRVATRFPPEPNGYLHIGHAKSICLNFGLAKDFQGTCNLRFDDTNPVKEDVEYVESIQEDVKWLGYSWDNRMYYASDYFEKLYSFAVELIKMGKAYVCDLNAEEIRKFRGTLTEPGKESPYRNRTAEENLSLFSQMRAGQFGDGEKVLRAKIDMNSPNINMRDPVIYRIKKAHHHRTGNEWCIYPMYDYTHCLSDMLEGITHSICTLEFEDHRPLYDWVLDVLKTPCHPQQIEFARLNIDYTVMSKRKLLQLVQEKKVSGWDDPRMPTIQGFRRRGVTPAAIRNFCDRIGVTKKDSCIEMSYLEMCIREDLDANAPRAMAVLNPMKVIIENYPENQVEELEVPNHPNKPEMGTRKVKFSREIYIEAEDFMENPSNKFFRLAVGKEVRLRSAYYITCTGILKDEKSGAILEIRCTYDPTTKGGWSKDARKVKGTLHWVSKQGSLPAEVRLYDRLFNVPNPGAGESNFLEQMNPNSLTVLANALIEESLANCQPEDRFQFERQGYFCADRREYVAGKRLVFNRTVTLKDSWSKN